MKTAREAQMQGEFQKIQHLAGLGSRQSESTDVPGYRVPVSKRMLDIGCLLLALPTLLPLFAVMALFIKIVSPGPVFFRQQRVGAAGQQTGVYRPGRSLPAHAERRRAARDLPRSTALY